MWRSGLVVIILAAAACAHADGGSSPAGQGRDPGAVQPPAAMARPLSTADAQALAEFQKRLEAYTALHNKMEKTLPALPDQADPKVIDTHQRALEKLLRRERASAKQGDIITPDTQRVFRQLLGRVFSGREGQQLKATILDENPGNIQLVVNSRYPDEVPMSTVPPQVLASLPKLPEELEYRFIGERLILLDVHAHTIADYMDNAFPRS